MALLPIIYTSLLVVLGLFIIVFSVSYISYKYRGKVVPAHTTAKTSPIKKQIIQERINNLSIQNIERAQVSNQNVLRINENKQINVIKREAEIVHNYRPKKRNRFSIIDANDTRKFNQFSESIEVGNFTPIQALTIENYRDMDMLKFYDE